MMLIGQIFILLCSITIINSYIHVINGKIKNENSDININCKYIINDTIIYSNDTVVPGIFYGLIYYECEHIKGYLLSKPECFECGIYCPQNDLILQCEHFTFPFILGLFVSMLLTILLFLFYNYILVKIILKIKTKYNIYKNNKSNKKIKKIHFKIRELENYEDINNVSIHQDTVTIHTNNNSNVISNEVQNPNQIDASTSVEQRRMYPSLGSVAMAAGIILSTGTNNTYACDQTLFLQSSGLICDKYNCQNVQSYTFGMTTGSTICFRTVENEIMKFEIINTKNTYRFMAQYYTSEYDISTEHKYNCKGAGFCTNEFCYTNAKHPNFKNESGLIKYDCKTEGLGCEQLCWHKYACTWYKVILKSRGKKFKIYKLYNTIWDFDLKVTYKDIIKLYKFNSYNIQNELDIAHLFNNFNFPISINSVHTPTNSIDNFAVIIDNTVFNVDANEMNYPIVGKIGDYQISLDNNEEIYPIENINCQIYGCKPSCVGINSTITRFIQSKNKNTFDEYKYVDDNQLDVYIFKDMFIQLTIGNVQFKNLYVEPAGCKVDILYTYGCIGCNKIPYVILQSSEIKNYGNLPFISNCSFTRQYISCRNEPYILNPMKSYEHCKLYIPSTNQTVYINFLYEFKGNLDKIGFMRSSDLSVQDVALSVLSNQNFLDAISYGLVSFTFISILITFLSRLIIRLLTFKTINKNNNVK